MHLNHQGHLCPNIIKALGGGAGAGGAESEELSGNSAVYWKTLAHICLLNLLQSGLLHIIRTVSRGEITGFKYLTEVLQFPHYTCLSLATITLSANQFPFRF